MPYASGPSVRRLSKIATLLLAKNYIVMLQRTVDELRHLLVNPAHHDDSSRTPTGGQSAAVKHLVAPTNSPKAQPASAPPNAQLPKTGVLPSSAPPAEVVLAMTSHPSAVLNERLRSHLSMRQRERVGGPLDWSAMCWQREMLEQHHAGIPLIHDSNAMLPGRCHPSMAVVPAGGGLLLPWIDCASIPLMASRQPCIHAASVTDTHRGVVRSFWYINVHSYSLTTLAYAYFCENATWNEGINIDIYEIYYLVHFCKKQSINKFSSSAMCCMNKTRADAVRRNLWNTWFELYIQIKQFIVSCVIITDITSHGHTESTNIRFDNNACRLPPFWWMIYSVSKNTHNNIRF